ncbi:kinase-associated lipoprotein B [Bacillus sp. H-16]|uniref:kinase-associated lipoprotein B n=1 Tax=Alteribacter salitolerans TaxID=2912333 RepID=UPI0019637D84|nr:kinase-associated lipoprotein B [Alteribacter salitolerans]MBM7094401.1 kinase-associated lipoprotein B [Alteribacter salitolerans]
MNETYQVGETVTGLYKTGKYIGEITEIKQDRYVLKIKAVLKHPKQGDLHNPNQVNVPLFHERRALGEREKTNVPKAYVKPYEGEVPPYRDSLKKALHEEMSHLEDESTEWSQKALENLKRLEKDYFGS